MIVTFIRLKALISKKGDKEGGAFVQEYNFQELYQIFGKRLYGFLLSLSRNESLAEELLQETFYQAFLHIHSFEGRCSIYTWLCQIGKNAWLKEIRKNKRLADISLEQIQLSEEFTPEEEYIQKEKYLQIRKCLLSMDEPYRNVFILHAVSDIKLKEIAALYNKSESWARVTYYRARMKIIEEVSE